MRHPFLLFLIILIASFHASAQKKEKLTDPQDYRYKKQAAGGLRIQTNGLSIYGEYGWIKDIYRTRLIQLEYTYYIDYRQKKQKSQTEGGRDYLYGFQNRLHMIHLSYGLERVIADKARRNGVRLSFVFFGGLSLGLLKPYYLELNQPGDTNSLPTHKPERYSSGNEDRFLNKSQIFGAAPIRYGLSQIQPVPGLHTKSALNFDWGSKDEFVKALEAGVMLDVFYKRLPIMVNNHNRFYQIALYLSFHFGKRW
jgi:hypothetical protein